MKTTTRHQKNNIICLIYILCNSVNNKVYVGQTWRTLKERMGTGYNGCAHLARAIKKYGIDKFYYEVMCIANTQEIADYWEQYFIKKFDSTNKNKGYNLRDGGANGTFSLESKQKMSQAHLGSTRTDEQKEKCSISKMGNKNPSSKITTEIAREIFSIYHNDPTISCDILSQIYGLHKSNINNIVNRISWTESTKNIPSTRIKNGKTWARTKLTKTQAIEIKQKLSTQSYSYRSLAREYAVSDTTIRNIANGKIWQDI